MFTYLIKPEDIVAQSYRDAGHVISTLLGHLTAWQINLKSASFDDQTGIVTIILSGEIADNELEHLALTKVV